jgi:hypothetical protein
MNHNRLTKYATLAFLASCLATLNNCGSKTAKHEEHSSINAENSADYYNGIVPIFRTPIVEPLPPYEFLETNCNDGHDDDGDGLVDCQDNDCHIHPECSEFGPPLEEHRNSRGTVVYPNGILAVEDIVIRNGRPFDDDDNEAWPANGFCAHRQKDCWIRPVEQDPYYLIPLGEPLLAGFLGPIGPQVDPSSAVAYFGPRAGLINECEIGTDIMFHHTDDDDGHGAGAGGDNHINENDDDFIEDNTDRDTPRHDR